MSAVRSTMLLSAAAVLWMCGCGEPDYAGMVDAKVTEEWMRPGMYKDAIEYLESGGNYYNAGPAAGAYDMDRQAILPFLKDLKREFGDETELYAILLEGQSYAWGIVMKLPERSGEARVEAFLEKAEETFPGMIITEWGREWLSFDFLGKDESEMIRKARARARGESP